VAGDHTRCKFHVATLQHSLSVKPPGAVYTRDGFFRVVGVARTPVRNAPIVVCVTIDRNARVAGQPRVLLARRAPVVGVVGASSAPPGCADSNVNVRLA
jgi:hypothetical protein